MTEPPPRGVVGWFARLTLPRLVAFLLLFPLAVALVAVFGLFPLVTLLRGG